ncbi:MAG: hypothetical protein PVF05_03870 [Gemmatimonadales bacterium]|jgi:tetratricopeptide (TPR) repeat protein
MNEIGRPLAIATLLAAGFLPWACSKHRDTAGADDLPDEQLAAFTATMAGNRKQALAAARQAASNTPIEVARGVPSAQNALVLPLLTLVSFGDWQEALRLPAPDTCLELATAMHRYAHGTALAALGRRDEARALLGQLRNTSRTAAKAAAGDEAANPVLSIAAHALAGEIALRAGQPAVAAERFRRAEQIEDAMARREPPPWFYPIRHSLGRALLEAGQAEAAETAYREDLARFPENGWSLFGLALSLEAQGRTADAESVRARFREAWAAADVELTSSRF